MTTQTIIHPSILKFASRPLPIQGILPNAQVRIIAQEDFIFFGSKFIEQLTATLPRITTFNWQFKQGQKVLRQQVIATGQGSIEELMQFKQNVLCFVQHLSGIATYTTNLSDLIRKSSNRNSKCQFLAPAQTHSYLKEFKEAAIIQTGGVIDDSKRVLLDQSCFDNNEQFRSFAKRVNSQNQSSPIFIKITDSENTALAVEIKAKRIILKNMDLNEIKQSLSHLSPFIETEVHLPSSEEDAITSVAKTGVNFISIQNAVQQFLPTNFKFNLDILNKSNKNAI